jgi:hypothetical protein
MARDDGRPTPCSCGRTRREFLWEAGAGFTGLALTYLLDRDGFFGRARAAEMPPRPPASPLALKSPHFPAPAKSVIFLFMYGGPSQVDTFDYKPELQKRNGQKVKIETRRHQFSEGTLLASRREFRRCGRSGVMVSDLFPHLAGCADELAVIRSMYADSFAHGSAMLQMNSGSLFQGRPCLGSWVSYGLGTENEDLPAFVVMIDPRGGPISGAQNWSSGYMPATYQGTQLRAAGDPLIDLQPPAGSPPELERLELEALRRLNGEHLAARPGYSELSARVASYELAYQLQATAPEATDLNRESEATRKLYGLDNPRCADFGRKCLLARRLVERGVRFIQIYSGGGHLDENWDAHSNVEENHRLHAAESDQPTAGLIMDLKSRGLLDSTLIVWGGEFGRQPVSQNGVGRDHNPKGFSVWLAGGGIQGGTVVGETDEFGHQAVVDPYHVHDLHATILNQLGMDHEKLTYFYGGRKQRLTDVSGTLIRQVIGKAPARPAPGA